jgi:hypothetical protein
MIDKILRKLGLCRTSNVLDALMQLRDFTHDETGVNGSASYVIFDKDWRKFVRRAQGIEVTW